MKGLFWLVVFGFVLASAGIVWYVLRKFKERQRAEEARMASFLAATAGKARLVDVTPAPAQSVKSAARSAAASADAGPISLLPAGASPVAGDGLAQQKMLFEAADKAGEAGEPVLAIQLYARLVARYPASAFVPQARAAAEILKKKLVKA
jgi:TolA-binding protein